MKHLSKNYFQFFLLIFLNQPFNLQGQNLFIPETALVQHAGSIGYFSAGVGYNLFRDNKGSLDILWGYVPESKGGRQHIFTSKFAYRPLTINIRNFGVIHALNPGVFLSYHGENAFYDKRKYPKGYYWWPSAIRSHLSLSTELKFKTPQALGKYGLKHFSIYQEINTNDLYFVSWAINREQLPLNSVLKLGIGIKSYF